MEALFALLYLAGYAGLLLTFWAPVSAVRRSPERYPEGQSKRVWVPILIVAFTAQVITTLVFAIPFPSGLIAACAYALMVWRPGRRLVRA